MIQYTAVFSGGSDVVLIAACGLSAALTAVNNNEHARDDSARTMTVAADTCRSVHVRVDARTLLLHARAVMSKRVRLR